MFDRSTRHLRQRPVTSAADGRPSRRPQIAGIASGLVVLALLWLGLAYHLQLRQESIRQQTHRDVLNLSVALEQQVERLIANVDQVMGFLRDDFTRDPKAFDFEVWVRRSTSLQTVANQISMFDEAGGLIAAKTPLSPGMPLFNVRDRAYFQALSGKLDPGLYIDRTVKGRLTGRHVMQLARRLSRADGGFAGVLVVSLDPEYLAQQFKAIDVGASGSVALFGRDGYIRARYPATEGMYDRDATAITTGKGVFEHLKTGSVGTYQVKSAFDGAVRIFGYRVVGDHPLIVTVGKSLDEVMLPFEQERHRVLAVGFAITAVLLAAVLALVRELEGRRRREILLVEAHGALESSEATLRETNGLHASAERVAQVGHWYMEAGNPIVRWSDELYRIYGVDKETFAPSFDTFGPMFHPDDRERIETWWRGELDRGSGTDCEHRIVTRTGETKTILVRNAIERDPEGRVITMVGAVLDVTEHRLAEAALARTTALLTQTLDTMDQGLIMVDAQGDVQVSNRRATELLDLPADLMASRPSYRLVRERARRAKRWGKLVEDASHWTLDEDHRSRDLRCERRSSTGHVLEIRTNPTPDGGLVQTFTDISDRRNAEDRYRLIAENASDLVTLRPAREARRTYVSPASRAIVGFTPEELADLPDEQYIHPDDLSRVTAELASLTPAVPRRMSEYRVRHKAGHFVWVEAVSQLTKAGAADEAVVVTARDVTARRAADEALRESEARHRLLAETTGDIIARLDLDGTLRYLSPAVDAVVGYAPEDMIGRKAMAFIHADDCDGVLQEFRALVAAGPGARTKFEYRIRHRDGRYVWLEVNPTVLFDEAGTTPLGIIDVARDVTARKADEAELLAARQTTEAARLQAEQASRAKTDFLASMSHEIRTPLNSVIGYTELLLDEISLSKDQRIQAERIQSAGSALLTIVNDILDFSKIEAGEIDLDHTSFELDGLIDDAVSIVRAMAEGKGLTVRVRTDPGLPSRLFGDQDRLRQILLNFLNNAVKFTLHGHITLSVTRLSTVNAPSRFRFAVTDTGIGIPAEKQARLFQRFSQVDGSVRREFGGTGLGLAISKSLVELMGGSIGVDSAAGRGSTFWFEVVLPDGDAREAGIDVPSPEIASRSLLILLVEDIVINQELARAVLERSGHVVDVASDGLEAIVAVQTKPYDLVLMDVQMPGMDGVTATRHIRAMAHPVRDIPIVAMTANVLPAQVAEFRAAGMNDHVGKPFRREELYTAIERAVLGRAEVSKPTPRRAVTPCFDRSVFDDMVTVIGPSRIGELLDQLAVEIESRLDDETLALDDRMQIRHGAHALVSSTGLMGFPELSGLCAELEAACLGTDDLRKLIDDVTQGRDRALAGIRALRSAVF